MKRLIIGGALVLAVVVVLIAATSGGGGGSPGYQLPLARARSALAASFSGKHRL